MQSSYWIERGSDGRAYYARKKPALPSFRRVVTEALRDIRSNNRFSDRPATDNISSSHQQREASQVAQGNTSTDTSTPKPKSKIQRSRATTPKPYLDMTQNSDQASNPPYSQPQTHPQHPYQYPMYPTFPPYPIFPQPSAFGENNIRREDHSPQTDTGALTHYAAPHPRMYPYIPQGIHPLPVQSMTPQGNAGGHLSQGRPPAGHYMPQPNMPSFPPMGPGHNPMAGVHFSQDLEKPKCSECGRTRSSRYRWKHALVPGQPARANICRRCRKTATDSEDEGTNSEDERFRRCKSHSRRRSGGPTSRPQSAPRPRVQSRARSSNRRTYRNDLDNHPSRELDMGTSESDGSEYDQSDTRNGGRRRYRSYSSSDGIVRHRNIPIHRSKSRQRKVIYVDAPRDRIEFSDSEGDVEIRCVNHHASGPVTISRPPTPAARLPPHQPSNHHFQAPVVIEHREYYHEPEPPRQLTRTPSILEFGSRNPYRQDRSMSVGVRRYDVEPYDPRKEEYYYERGTDGSSRGRISGRLIRSGSRSRVGDDDGAGSRLRDPLFHRAPSPPPLRRRSSSVRIISSRDRESCGEPQRGFQSHSRASSRGQRRSEVEGRRYGGDSPPVDDYDWYDKDGMRVRVREI